MQDEETITISKRDWDEIIKKFDEFIARFNSELNEVSVSQLYFKMNLIDYIGLRVKIILHYNHYYYVEIVTNATENSIELKDIKGNKVSLSSEAILSIQEVKK